MSKGWTPERRAAQSAAIRRWRPWDQSTGPRTAEGKQKVSRNAFRGGYRQQSRELTKALNAALRSHQSHLGSIAP